MTVFVDDFGILRIIYPRDYDVRLSPCIKGMPLSNYREMFIKLWVEQLVEMNNFLIILTCKVGQPLNWIRKHFQLLIGCEQMW